MLAEASTEDTSYGVLNENRREFRERAETMGVHQGWNTVLFRIIFFDFILARFGVKTQFFGKADNCSIRFVRCSDPDTKCTWKECREDTERDSLPPWRRSRPFSDVDPSNSMRSYCSLLLSFT